MLTITCSHRQQLHRYGHTITCSRSHAHTGDSYIDMAKDDLEEKYTPISADKAEVTWNSSYEYFLDYCTHGSNCKQVCLSKLHCS